MRTGVDRASNGVGGRIVEGVAEFGNDVATLFELQAKLAALDAQESARKAIRPLAAAAVAVFVIAGAVTVGLFGVADLLARALSVPSGWAMVATAAAALLFAGAMLWYSAISFKESAVPLRRSREELTRNLAWLRTVLVHSGRSAPNRGD